jgi:hypothetical protein
MIRLFEEFNIVPKVGDYVLCEDDTIKSVSFFVSRNIGQIIMNNGIGDEYPYLVRYSNIPLDIIDYFDYSSRDFSKEEILHFSKDIEELKAIISSRKFNL